MSLGPAFFQQPFCCCFPSLWRLSGRFGAGPFNRVQVIRGVGNTGEQKAVWRLCLRFHLPFKPNAAVRQVATYCTFTEGLGWWDELLLIFNTVFGWLSNHAFSGLLTISPLSAVLFSWSSQFVLELLSSIFSHASSYIFLYISSFFVALATLMFPDNDQWQFW